MRDFTIYDVLALLGTMPSDPASSRSAALRKNAISRRSRAGVPQCTKKTANCLALIAHWHVDHCANTNTQRAIEIIAARARRTGKPNYQRVAIDEWLVQTPKLVKPVSTGDAHPPGAVQLCFNVDRLTSWSTVPKPCLGVARVRPTMAGWCRRHPSVPLLLRITSPISTKSGLEFS